MGWRPAATSTETVTGGFWAFAHEGTSATRVRATNGIRMALLRERTILRLRLTVDERGGRVADARPPTSDDAGPVGPCLATLPLPGAGKGGSTPRVQAVV